MTQTRALATERLDDHLRMTVDFRNLLATVRIPNGKHKTAVSSAVHLQIMYCNQFFFKLKNLHANISTMEADGDKIPEQCVHL